MCKVQKIGIPKVSVIVPVYRAEKYICRCLDSLLVQTLPDFEVICVDDGSPDKSGVICEQYKKCDARIFVVHQDNAGVSMARQRGLDAARGEYTIHVDPDDWVEPDMLEALYKKAKEEDADLVICDYFTEYGTHIDYRRQMPSSLDSDTVLRELFQQLHGSCCNKLIKRVCYNDFGIRFPRGISYCEDLYVVSSLLLHPVKIAYVDRAFYHYCLSGNPNSLVANLSLADFNSNVRLVALMRELLHGSRENLSGMRYVEWNLLVRSFRGHYFSSKEFRKECSPYKSAVALFGNKFPMDFYLFFSCRGLYGAMFAIYQTSRSIKLLIVKLLMQMKLYNFVKKIFGGGENPSLEFCVAAERSCDIQLFIHQSKLLAA